MARTRNHARRDLPPNLYVRNGGYYCYRDPRTGKEYGLGRDKRLAVTEAIAANMAFFGSEELKPLAQRLQDENNVTLHAWLVRYDEIVLRRELKEKTMANHRSRMKAFRSTLPDKAMCDFTTRDIADFLNGYVEAGKAASAKLMRGALLDVFREAVADGIIQHNPVEASRNPKVEVKRARLLLDEFLTIRAQAVNFPSWFRIAMDIALVTGQRISDICNMRWADIVDFRLRVVQEKTGARITIPVELSIAGLSLENLFEECWELSAGCEFILVSRKGEKIAQRTMTDYFTKSRRLTPLSWDADKEPPSFHEIRSLSARLHTDARGGEFAQHLLGHKSAEMTARYQDSRGSEWDDIQI
ncbi:site-specific integrase [Serratia marcescens]|uniref:site-specific integrase n=1 Tax=Serratia marcescens TaxID=615 RepID=UPI0018661DBF|nr:tyrosine-type recombinase/integrase [Serratia marcescens]